LLQDADVEKARQEHEDQMKAKDDRIQDLETKFQEVETARGTLEVNLRQKVVD
jgi:hypothetical protein